DSTYCAALKRCMWTLKGALSLQGFRQLMTRRTTAISRDVVRCRMCCCGGRSNEASLFRQRTCRRWTKRFDGEGETVAVERLTQERLDELRRIAEAATKGPWRVNKYGSIGAGE